MIRRIVWGLIVAAVSTPCFALCTTVSADGVCDRHEGVAFCNTPDGALKCPDGYHHVSSSSTPFPCVPEGGPCTRTVRCCKNNVLPVNDAAADVGTCETPETAPLQPVAKTQPVPGLECRYTCTEGGTEWIMLCAKNTEDECCDIADQGCPYLVPGSTGVVSCSC